MNMAQGAMAQRFAAFAGNLAKLGRNPQEVVQQLLDSGGMSQQQYENLRREANRIMGTNF